MKGITPIISIIVLLLIVVAMGAVAYNYLYGYYTATTANTISKQPGSEFETTVIIRNMGTEPLLTSNLEVTVEGQTATLVEPTPTTIPAGRTAVLAFDTPVYGNNLLVRIIGPNNVISYRVSIPMPEGFMIWLTEPNPDMQNNTFTANWYIFINATANQELATCVAYANGFDVGIDGVDGPYCWKNYTVAIDGPVYFYIEGDNGTELAETEHMEITIDTSPPILSFVDPTPDDDSGSENLYFEVNVSANENLETCELEHNRSGSYENQSMTEYGSSCYWNLTGLAADTTVTYRVWGSDFVPHWSVTGYRSYNALSSGGDTDPPDLDWFLIDMDPAENNSHGTQDYIFAKIVSNEVLTGNDCYFEHNLSGVFVNETGTIDFTFYCFYNLTEIPKDQTRTIFYRMHANDAANNWNVTTDRAYTVDQSEFSFSFGDISLNQLRMCVSNQTGTFSLDADMIFNTSTDYMTCGLPTNYNDYGAVFSWEIPFFIPSSANIDSVLLFINNSDYYWNSEFGCNGIAEGCRDMNTWYFYKVNYASGCYNFNNIQQDGLVGYHAMTSIYPAYIDGPCSGQLGNKTWTITGSEANALVKRKVTSLYFDIHADDIDRSQWLVWGGHSNPDSVRPQLEINFTLADRFCPNTICEYQEACAADCSAGEAPNLCGDHVDNDENGWVDCREPSCDGQSCDEYCNGDPGDCYYNSAQPEFSTCMCI